MTYYPDYIQEIKSPDDLIQGIRNTLELWLMIHTDAETWVNEWTCDNDSNVLQDLLEHGIKNNYFSFDLQESVLKKWCKDNLHYFVQCKDCNYIAEEYYNDECSCETEDESGNPIELDDDRWVKCDLDDLIEYTKDIGMPEKDKINYVNDALLDDGFKVYREHIIQYTSPIENDCKTAIENIDTAESNEDRLSFAMSAAGIYHVNGEIMKDYGDRVGFDYDDLCKLRSDGLTVFFDKETIKKWLEN